RQAPSPSAVATPRRSPFRSTSTAAPASAVPETVAGRASVASARTSPSWPYETPVMAGTAAGPSAAAAGTSAVAAADATGAGAIAATSEATGASMATAGATGASMATAGAFGDPAACAVV